jgi:hypothetical protein
VSGLDPGAVYRALQEVADGADPADEYAKLMGDSIDPEEAIQEAIADAAEEAHDFDECRYKHECGVGFCMGTTCKESYSNKYGTVRLTVDCPCKCHEGEVWD